MKTTEIFVYTNALITGANLKEIWLFTILFSIAMSKSTIILSSFLPPASIMLIASINIIIPKLNIFLIWLAITLGATTGSIISYYLGNQITRKNLFKCILRRYQSTIYSAHNKLKKQGIAILFTSRFIAVLRYMIPLAAGMLLMNRIKVYSICLLSSTIWSIIFILLTKYTLNIVPPKFLYNIFYII